MSSIAAGPDEPGGVISQSCMNDLLVTRTNAAVNPLGMTNR